MEELRRRFVVMVLARRGEDGATKFGIDPAMWPTLAVALSCVAVVVVALAFAVWAVSAGVALHAARRRRQATETS